MKTELDTNRLLFGCVLATLLALRAPTHAGEMQASDGAAGDFFGFHTSISGTLGLVGAWLDDIGANNDQGSAYIFRNLDTATGTVFEHAKLVASDGLAADTFGYSATLSGTVAIVGSYLHDVGLNTDQGAAYVFRNLDTAVGTVNENAKLLASDGSAGDWFAHFEIGLSGFSALVGAYRADIGLNPFQGAAYVFRNLDTATGTVNENAKLLASDGLAGDLFGFSNSLSGSIGIVGAPDADIGTNFSQGSAYVFRNLDTATGTVNENAKLVSSDGGSGDRFGEGVSISGSIGLVGAFGHDVGLNSDQGAVYVFRNLDSVTGIVNENAKLVASDGAANDRFGGKNAISGTVALVGAFSDIGSNVDQGSAYVYRNLDTVTGTVFESVKIYASNGAANDYFGFVSLDGDRFVIGALFRDIGSNTNQGNAYFGHVRTFTTADLGSDATATDGLSFESRDDWIIGQTTSNNSVTLTSGDSGNVGRVGLVNPTTAQTYIGQNAGSNDNTLHVESGATLTSNSVNVGASGNSGNQLRANGTINLSSGSVLDVFDGNILSGAGTIQGHGGNTSNTVTISGSLRPGSGNLGSGIGTLTRNDGDVTWNGNASSPWVFDLGLAQATMALANTGGTRDLLNITSGDFLKGTGSNFVFDFNGTGADGWYKLVDWTGTTNFSAADFTATNLNPAVLSYTFHIDNGGGSTTALYIHLVIPEPQVWAVLSALLGVLVVIRQRLRKAARA